MAGSASTLTPTTSLGNLTRSYDEAKSTGSSDSFRKVWDALRTAEDTLREHIQESTSAQIAPVIQKLRSKGQARLTGEELDLVRQWVIGDVQRYTELENNFDDWNVELKRLMAEIKKIGAKPMGTREAFHVGALVRDASNVVRSIREYLDCKERLKRFEDSAKNPTPESRDALADVLEGRLESDMF